MRSKFQRFAHDKSNVAVDERAGVPPLSGPCVLIEPEMNPPEHPGIVDVLCDLPETAVV
jgi:hypothetical protein